MELATGAMGTLLPKLGELLLEDYKLEKSVRKQVGSLRQEMQSMEADLLKTAEVPPDQLDEQVKIWVSEVKELSYVIEDCIDRFMMPIGDDSDPVSFSGFLKKISICLKNLKPRRRIGQEIQDLRHQFIEVAARGHRYKASLAVAVDVPVATTATLGDMDNDHGEFVRGQQASDEVELVGIQEAVDEVIRLLTERGENQQQLKILSIVGLGGLGKTTLASAVCERMRTQFDCTAFISVGQSPNLKAILEGILFQIDKEKYSFLKAAAADETRYTDEIQELLKNKRYFIILDDIWTAHSWEIIRCTLMDCKVGSIILTTTRIQSIAVKAGDVYNLKPLSHDNSEALMYMILFGGRIQLPDEQSQIIQKILQKCGGLPLAIVAMARHLSRTPKENWYRVYSSIAFTDQNTVERVRKIIMLSYYDLPIHLRACLLYLSIFPEDYVIRKDALIWMWIAEGFIRDESGVGLFEIGERYFNELIQRSMIIPVNISHTDDIISCCVHDIIHEIICSVAKEENFVTLLNGNEQHTNARRLALHGEVVEKQHPLANTDMPQVRSFNAIGCDTTKMPSLVSFELLRVLSIEDCNSFRPEGNVYSPKDIGKLLYLRYLGLWKTPVSKLPDEVGNLKYLEILDLRQTGIRELPKSICQLRRLKCLHADGGSTRVPDWIGNLTSLEELSLNDVSSCPNFVKEVSKLTELRELKIWIRVLDERSKKALVKSLSNLPKIQVLHLDGGLFIEDALWEGYVPPRQLCRLRLRIKSSRLPRWINNSLLPNLSHLSVDVMVLDKDDLEILGRFPELTILELFMPNGVPLDVEGCPGGSFPKLRHCYASGMLRFLQRAAPILESVHFNVMLSALNGASFQCGFLGNLPLLMEVRVEIFYSDVEVYHAEAVEEALRRAVALHGNRPKPHVSKFKQSFDEAAEKEEDNGYLEEDL